MLPLVADPADRVQLLLQRRRPTRLNPRFVHIRVIQIGDLVALRLRHLLDQRRRPLVAQVGQLRERAHTPPVRRYVGLLQPRAIAILEEVVARLHRIVHVRGNDAVLLRGSGVLGNA